MVGRRSLWLGAAVLCSLRLLFAAGFARAQEVPRGTPAPAAPARPDGKLPVPADLQDAAKRERTMIDKMIADYDLTPRPLPPVPDDPPPHEARSFQFSIRRSAARLDRR